MKKAKGLIEFSLSKHIKGNTKGLYMDLNDNWKIKVYVGILLK